MNPKRVRLSQGESGKMTAFQTRKLGIRERHHHFFCIRRQSTIEIRDRQESEIRTRIAKERGTNQGIGVENGQTTKSFEEKE